MKSLLLAALALVTPLAAQLPLVPKPVSLQAGQGAAFQLGSNTQISYSGEDSAAAELLAARPRVRAVVLPLSLLGMLAFAVAFGRGSYLS